MTKIINKNYKKLQNNYIFTEISQKITKYLEHNTQADIISLGIGDVSLPLGENLVNVMTKELEKQKTKQGFVGYPPEVGYPFLRNAISRFYKKRKIQIEVEEVFVSNGAGCDIGNILDLFSNLTAVIQDPTYPAYFDSNVLSGNKIKLIRATHENNFLPSPKGLKKKSYLIYLCSPNNPTGQTLGKKELKEWVDFANSTNSIIIFDSAYSCFVSDDSPKSIFEIKGSKTCAIEIASFSKMAGFTNIRCGYTIVPKNLIRQNLSLNKMWNRRQCTKFNGVPYFVQKGAEYVLSDDGQNECQKNVNYYKNNVQIIKNCLNQIGLKSINSSNSPYIWVKVKDEYTSWKFFDELLNNCQVVCVPGVGFGKSGEGYVRFSGFGSYENTMIACKRMIEYFKK